MHVQLGLVPRSSLSSHFLSCFCLALGSDLILPWYNSPETFLPALAGMTATDWEEIVFYTYEFKFVFFLNKKKQNSKMPGMVAHTGNLHLQNAEHAGLQILG